MDPDNELHGLVRVNIGILINKKSVSNLII